jgi:hypothetical protein
MDSLFVHVSEEASPDKFASGIYLCLYHTDSIPPHIILIVHGKYYSLSVRGSEITEPVNKLYRRISQSRSKVLFIHINLNYQGSDPALFFNKYAEPQEGKVTCLTPVREYLQSLTSHNLGNCHFVFDLYRELNKHGLTGPALHLHMEEILDHNKNFKLNTYTLSDIDRCIWMNRLTGSEC